MQLNLNTVNRVFEIDKYDLMILNNLTHGYTKKQIPEKLKKLIISTNSESTIDKMASKLFDQFGSKKTYDLIAKLIKQRKI